MGTDSYVINQDNTPVLTSDADSLSVFYSLSVTDSVSTSWQDTGEDVLLYPTSTDGICDTYTWNDFHSVTGAVGLDYTDTSIAPYTIAGSMSSSEGFDECLSIGDVQSETVVPGNSGGTIASDTFSIVDVTGFQSSLEEIADPPALYGTSNEDAPARSPRVKSRFFQLTPLSRPRDRQNGRNSLRTPL